MKILITAILFIVTIASGIWLAKLGKPYKTGIFTLHKLIALGTIIFIGYCIYIIQKDASFSVLEKSLIIVSAVLLLITLVSGGVLSVVKGTNFLMIFVHRIATLLSVISIGFTLYFLKNLF